MNYISLSNSSFSCSYTVIEQIGLKLDSGFHVSFPPSVVSSPPADLCFVLQGPEIIRHHGHHWCLPLYLIWHDLTNMQSIHQSFKAKLVPKSGLCYVFKGKSEEPCI